IPDGLSRGALRIIMLVFGVEGGMIRVRFPHHLRDSDDCRWIGIAVVEQNLITCLHHAHVVACLIIAHAVPAGGLPWSLLQILDRKRARFGLHQPIPRPLSHRTASSPLVSSLIECYPPARF